jgi:uncharacterized membrane protein
MNVCARCLGGYIGIAIGAIAAFFLGVIPLPFYFLLPVPAFIDWGGRMLGFFESGKMNALASGIALGLAIPSFFHQALSWQQAAFLSGAIYLVIFIAIWAESKEI